MKFSTEKEQKCPLTSGRSIFQIVENTLFSRLNSLKKQKKTCRPPENLHTFHRKPLENLPLGRANRGKYPFSHDSTPWKSRGKPLDLQKIHLIFTINPRKICSIGRPNRGKYPSFFTTELPEKRKIFRPPENPPPFHRKPPENLKTVASNLWKTPFSPPPASSIPKIKITGKFSKIIRVQLKEKSLFLHKSFTWGKSKIISQSPGKNSCAGSSTPGKSVFKKILTPENRAPPPLCTD